MVKLGKYIRITLLVIIALSVFLTQPIIENFSVQHVSLGELFFGFFGSFFGVIIVIWLQTTNKMQNLDLWLEINWNTNPFSMKQPIQFLNYSGWTIFISYIFPTINTYIKYPEYTLNGIQSLCFGLGIIFGTHVSSYLFIKK